MGVTECWLLLVGVVATIFVVQMASRFAYCRSNRPLEGEGSGARIEQAVVEDLWEESSIVREDRLECVASVVVTEEEQVDIGVDASRVGGVCRTLAVFTGVELIVGEIIIISSPGVVLSDAVILVAVIILVGLCTQTDSGGLDDISKDVSLAMIRMIV
jgi:hypothetical protein